MSVVRIVCVYACGVTSITTTVEVGRAEDRRLNFKITKRKPTWESNNALHYNIVFAFK